MSTTSLRTTAPEVLVRRVLDADGTESATVRLRCPECRRSLLLRDDAIREFLAMPLAGAMTAGVPRRLSALRPPRTQAAPSDLATVRLADVMVRDVVCVRPDTSIESLRTVLLDRGISGAPVVDEDGGLVGVVSKTDLVRWDLDDDETASEPPEQIDVELGPGFHAEYIPGGVVAEIMTPLTLSLPSRATVLQASALMAYEGVHRIVVVDDGEVVGIVTATDVLGWLARHYGWAVPRYTQSQRSTGDEAS